MKKKCFTLYELHTRVFISHLTHIFEIKSAINFIHIPSYSFNFHYNYINFMINTMGEFGQDVALQNTVQVKHL